MFTFTYCVPVWSCVNESSCPSCWVRCLLGATITSQTQVAALSWRLSNRSWRHTRFTDPARPPGRKGFCHLEHVRKSQHWLGQKTVGLSAAYCGRGLWQLGSWDSMRLNNTCDKFVCGIFRISRFPDFLNFRASDGDCFSRILRSFQPELSWDGTAAFHHGSPQHWTKPNEFLEITLGWTRECFSEIIWLVFQTVLPAEFKKGLTACHPCCGSASFTVLRPQWGDKSRHLHLSSLGKREGCFWMLLIFSEHIWTIVPANVVDF